jgi:hypothetical protein
MGIETEADQYGEWSKKSAWITLIAIDLKLSVEN